MIKRLWHDPVWSKVIATGIVAILAWIGTHFHWWSAALKAIEEATRWAMAFLLSTSPVPHWLLGLAGLIVACIVVLVVAIVSAIWTTDQGTVVPTSHAPEQSPWRCYTTDVFFTIRWRWKAAPDGSIEALCAFCPHCDYQLVGSDTFGMIEFHCDSCGRNLATLQESPESLRSKIIRLIQQKMRRGLAAQKQP